MSLCGLFLFDGQISIFKKKGFVIVREEADGGEAFLRGKRQLLDEFFHGYGFFPRRGEQLFLDAIEFPVLQLGFVFGEADIAMSARFRIRLPEVGEERLGTAVIILLDIFQYFFDTFGQAFFALFIRGAGNLQITLFLACLGINDKGRFLVRDVIHDSEFRQAH